MQVLQVFDSQIADKLRVAGWKEIKTQYGIRPAAWTFLYDKSMPLCFDIKEATHDGRCRIDNSFIMSF